MSCDEDCTTCSGDSEGLWRCGQSVDRQIERLTTKLDYAQQASSQWQKQYLAYFDTALKLGEMCKRYEEALEEIANGTHLVYSSLVRVARAALNPGKANSGAVE